MKTKNFYNFVRYVLNTYFETHDFPTELWNHYDTESETTNNYVEGDNLKMKFKCGSSNPNIVKATDLIIKSECISVNKYNNVIRKNSKQQVTKRENFERNICFRMTRRFHRAGSITTDEYLSKIKIFTNLFQKKNQKIIQVQKKKKMKKRKQVKL